jgi:hypothetical protein
MKLRLEIFILLFIFLIGAFFANYRIAHEKAVAIKDLDRKTNTVIPAPDGKFTLSFIHSVQKTPVYEFFRIDGDNKLVLYETKYYSLGVGLPFSEENGTFVNDKGEFVLNLTRTFDSIPIRVSPIPNHAISIGGRTYPLLNFAGPEDLVEIRAINRWIIKRKERENDR